VDPYLDPDTGILRNKVGARTQAELDAAEADLTVVRALRLLERPPAATGDLAELQAIHRELFADVFEWAGEIRTVDMRKNIEGAEFFLPVSMIARSAGFAADELRADNMLRGLGHDRFVERLAHHYDQFNYIHPMREGNGRTGRLFWDRVSRDAGWTLDWRTVSGRVNDHASRTASEQRDLKPLQEMFDRIAAPLERADREVSARLSRLALRRDRGTNELGLGIQE
jgi:cell filamentation protein